MICWNCQSIFPEVLLMRQYQNKNLLAPHNSFWRQHFSTFVLIDTHCTGKNLSPNFPCTVLVVFKHLIFASKQDRPSLEWRNLELGTCASEVNKHLQLIRKTDLGKAIYCLQTNEDTTSDHPNTAKKKRNPGPLDHRIPWFNYVVIAIKATKSPLSIALFQSLGSLADTHYIRIKLFNKFIDIN